MLHLLMVILLALLNFKYRSYKYTKYYLPTLIYVIFVNYSYYFLCKKHLLWKFHTTILSIKQVRMLHVFLTTPLMVLLFLTNFPKGFFRQLKYILKWTLASTLFEWIANKKLQMISFYNGWNIFWSGIIYLLMYSYSTFHVKKPRFIWLLSAITSLLLMGYFKVPVREEIVKGRVVNEFIHSLDP